MGPSLKLCARDRALWNREGLAGNPTIAQPGAGSLVFGRTPVVVRRPLVHALSPNGSGGIAGLRFAPGPTARAGVEFRQARDGL